MKHGLLTLFILTTAFTVSLAQIETPAPSPSGESTQKVGLTDITLDYSRPGVKDRVIFDENGLVPYGEIWRTGANAATTIEFSKDVTFGGTEVEAGKYALYTIPGSDEWHFLLYSDLELGGNVGEYDESKEVARVSAEPMKLPFSIETLVLDINNIRDNSATLDLVWADTKVGVPIEVHTDEQVMKQIDEFTSNPMSSIAGNYVSAGWYLYNTGKDLDKAEEYMTKGLEYSNSPFKFFWQTRLAQVQAAKGDYKAAMSTAKKAHESGMKAEGEAKGFYDDTVKAQLDQMISECKSKM